MQRIAIACVTSVAILAATAYFSATMGYNAGLADAPGHIKSPEAAYTVSVLDRIQAGDTASAIALLEADLDSSLVDRWVYDPRGRRPLSFLRPVEIAAIPALIGVGAQHRAKNPSANFSDKVRNVIEEVVKKYESVAPTPGLPNYRFERSRGTER
jgi:hypothetical protein